MFEVEHVFQGIQKLLIAVVKLWDQSSSGMELHPCSLSHKFHSLIPYSSPSSSLLQLSHFSCKISLVVTLPLAPCNFFATIFSSNPNFLKQSHIRPIRRLRGFNLIHWINRSSNRFDRLTLLVDDSVARSSIGESEVASGSGFVSRRRRGWPLTLFLRLLLLPLLFSPRQS